MDGGTLAIGSADVAIRKRINLIDRYYQLLSRETDSTDLRRAISREYLISGGSIYIYIVACSRISNCVKSVSSVLISLFVLSNGKLIILYAC